MSSSFKLFLIIIVTYIPYVFLITFSFIKINLRIKHTLNNYNLNSVLYYNYNIFSIIKGPISFFSLLILTFIPILHITGYFFVFAFLTEYTDKKILNIIINKELLSFKKELEEIKKTSLYKLFLRNTHHHTLEHKIKVICNYFDTDNSINSIFIFYQFLCFKDSFHKFYEGFKEDNPTESNLLTYYNDFARKIERDINITFNLIKKYELHYA